MRRMDLNGIWKLRCFDGQRGDNLARMLDPQFDLRHAWDARVPGDIHETLLEHGLIPEPTLGLNSLQCQWVASRLWIYRRCFESPKLQGNQRAWIVFESLDLAAEIYLNGRLVGRHSDRYYPFKAEVTDALLEGENLLVVQVESGLFHAMNRPAGGMGLSLDNELAKRPWLRKPQSSFGWDWSPVLLPVGILGSVYLDVLDSIRIDQVSLFSELSETLDRGKVTSHLLIESLQPKPIQISIAIPELQLRAQKEILPGENLARFIISLDVPNPELWWPVGHGSPRLYEVTVTLHDGEIILGQISRKLGFRHVNINQQPHPGRGRYFIAEINRKPIFLKGVNFVPADIIDRRVTNQTVETLLDLAREANCNCLRVWGGGLYESDCFYEECDTRGILVWQEFIFACSKYPGQDEAFLSDVKKEAAYQIRRLAHHPSLFVWCGNNEMEMAYASWEKFQVEPYHPDHAIFHVVLPRLLREEDPSRYYQPSSPFSPDAIAPNHDDYGDQHPWSIGFLETDFRLYRQMTCRFPNEGGFLGPTALSTIRSCLPPGQTHIGSFAWQHHENAISFWDKRCAADAALEQWLGLSIREFSLSDYAFFAGLLQGEALAEFIKNFRRRKFDSSGAIFWMFNDVWPTVRSWVIVDYYLRRTPSFHPVRRAFSPLTVVITQEKERVRFYGVNEGEPWKGQLRYGLCVLAGDYPLSRTIEVVLPANSSTCIAEFDFATWQKLGMTTHVAFALLLEHERAIAQDRLILPFFKEMQWHPRPEIQIDWDGNRARFLSKEFAWNLCLDLEGDKPFPDNFFDLLPGVPRELPWPASLGQPVLLRIGNSIANAAGAPVS